MQIMLYNISLRRDPPPLKPKPTKTQINPQKPKQTQNGRFQPSRTPFGLLFNR